MQQRWNIQAGQGIRKWKVVAFVALPLSVLAGLLPSGMLRETLLEETAPPPDTSLVPVYPQGYFRSPLDIPLNLSGNFGELRTNHFHAGIDIKTQQQEGLKVYAAAEGFVSRIKVSPVGYGYALYIDHPNGYTTVYGHLQKYSERIDRYVKEQQYAQKSFSVDLFPTAADLPLAKGEVIGLSGNSGGSGGPHLHFEVRETATEKVINPLLFGFDVRDKIPPSVNGIWIVPMNDTSWVNNGQSPVAYEVKSLGKTYGLKLPTPARIYGDVGFAIHTSDMLDGNSNRCGIYRIELFVDGLQVYGQRMDRLDFTTNRAMNAHTIYEKFKKDRSQLHGSYRLPGNPLDIYDNLVNDGIVSFRDGKVHDIEYRVVDLMDNLSVVRFQVQALASPTAKPTPPKPVLAHFDWEKDNSYDAGDVRIHIPAYTLYEDVDLTITRKNKMDGAITPTWLVVSPYEPVHAKYQLSLKVEKVPERYHDKLVVVRWDPDKDKVTSEGGRYADGYVTAEPTYLGHFAVKIDTVPPAVSSIDFSSNMRGRAAFSFRISDWLSGIDTYIPTIDGEWVVMEYDAKNSRLTYYFDPTRLQKGRHAFHLVVRDAVGNEKTFSGNFDW